MKAKRAFYSGRVQGVGFRATTHRLSRNFKIAGFVRNLNDGRVELFAQGENEEVDSFLGAIAETMGDYIVDSAISDDQIQACSRFEIQP